MSSSADDNPTNDPNHNPNDSNFNGGYDYLTFLSKICGSLKKIKRTGWVRSNIPLPESDADHMHRCAMCAMLVTTQPADPRDDYSNSTSNNNNNNSIFHPQNVNAAKLLKMALTHDLCESIAGDITPFCHADAIATKHDNEDAAMVQIGTIVGNPLGQELYELWKEYEEQVTVEALYCKDIDKFEMIMQAFEYEQDHLVDKVKEKEKGKESDNDNNDDGDVAITPLRTFYITTNDKMRSPLFRRLDAELRQKRETLLKERGWEVTDEERQQYT